MDESSPFFLFTQNSSMLNWSRLSRLSMDLLHSLSDINRIVLRADIETNLWLLHSLEQGFLPQRFDWGQFDENERKENVFRIVWRERFPLIPVDVGHQKNRFNRFWTRSKKMWRIEIIGRQCQTKTKRDQTLAMNVQWDTLTATQIFTSGQIRRLSDGLKIGHWREMNHLPVIKTKRENERHKHSTISSFPEKNIWRTKKIFVPSRWLMFSSCLVGSSNFIEQVERREFFQRQFSFSMSIIFDQRFFSSFVQMRKEHFSHWSNKESMHSSLSIFVASKQYPLTREDQNHHQQLNAMIHDQRKRRGFLPSNDIFFSNDKFHFHSSGRKRQKKCVSSLRKNIVSDPSNRSFNVDGHRDKLSWGSIEEIVPRSRRTNERTQIIHLPSDEKSKKLWFIRRLWIFSSIFHWFSLDMFHFEYLRIFSMQSFFINQQHVGQRRINSISEISNSEEFSFDTAEMFSLSRSVNQSNPKEIHLRKQMNSFHENLICREILWPREDQRHTHFSWRDPISHQPSWMAHFDRQCKDHSIFLRSSLILRRKTHRRCRSNIEWHWWHLRRGTLFLVVVIEQICVCVCVSIHQIFE